MVVTDDLAILPLPANEDAGPSNATVSAQPDKNTNKLILKKIFLNFPSINYSTFIHKICNVKT